MKITSLGKNQVVVKTDGKETFQSYRQSRKSRSR